MSVNSLKEYQYKIPEELIAQEPLKKRDEARLMIIDRKEKSIAHDVFKNLNKYLSDKTHLVLNDTKVVPARLLGAKERSGGKVEVFLLNKKEDGRSYEVLMKPLKKIKQNDRINFNSGAFYADVIDVNNRIVRFNQRNINSLLDDYGHMPLPPYIKRSDRAIDKKYYQTTYARKRGSVAAPTAGLHFTAAQLYRLKKSGHPVDYITLHVNYATFKPVECENITDHKMHTESYHMSKGVFSSLNNTKKRNQKICAVGTTSCRVLESVAKTSKLKGTTDLFIYPGYKFQYIDMLLTNFHLPESTLLMLVYAFGGTELMRHAYNEAIKNKYRFYSYGDAMIIK